MGREKPMERMRERSFKLDIEREGDVEKKTDGVSDVEKDINSD